MVVSKQVLGRYATAVLIVVLATLFRWALDPVLGNRAPLITYVIAVALAAWLGGTGPGLVSLVLSGLVSDYCFIPPRGSLEIEKLENVLGLLLFAITGLILVVLTEAQRQARQRAERSAALAIDRQNRLEVEIVHRERAEREREALLTEQARLRAIAEEQSATLASLFDQAPVGIVLFDPGLRLLRANNEAVGVTGRAPEQVIGRTLREALGAVVPGDEIAEVERILQQTLAGGDPYSVKRWSCGVDHPSRSVVHLDWSARRIDRPEGGTLGILGTIVDVTDEVEREQALRKSEELFRLAAEAVDGLIYDADMTTGRVERTRGLSELVGYQPDEVPATFSWWIEQVHPEDLWSFVGVAARRANDDGRSNLEYRVRHRDGQYVHVIDRSLAATDEAGVVVRYVGCIQDITEVREAELSLRDADRRKDDFLAVLAHEIRNPLASIRNSLRLIKRPEDGLEVFDLESERLMAERQVAHLARLIDDLMDVSRISQGRIELRHQPIELVSVLTRAIEVARSPMAAHRHELFLDLPDGPVRMEADPTRLEQVFGNLLNNATKYTPPGGRVWLSARVEGGEVAIKVRDTGLGIEPEMLSKVFEMYVQDKHHSGHAEGGLGIGLGLSRRLVELHGGRISARSGGPGLGSEFEVRLPFHELEPPPTAEPASNGIAADVAKPGRRRILVVDDNQAIANSLARLLSRVHGQEVRVAHNGLSALALADEFRPDLVLLDIGMPEMDGCELARRLREKPEFASTILVALTGWGQDADRKRSEAAGIDLHLVKPIDPDDLEALIAGASRAETVLK